MSVLLGKLCEKNIGRDSVHVNVLCVRASRQLVPGQDTGVVWSYDEYRSDDGMCIGKVDPFLNEEILPNELFLLCIYPGTIVDLKHSWVHPTLDNPSVIYIHSMAKSCGMTYEALMSAATSYVDDGDEVHVGSFEDYKSVHDWPLFWKHYAIVTGEVSKYTDCPFSCNCG